MFDFRIASVNEVVSGDATGEAPRPTWYSVALFLALQCHTGAVRILPSVV